MTDTLSPQERFIEAALAVRDAHYHDLSTAELITRLTEFETALDELRSVPK